MPEPIMITSVLSIFSCGKFWDIQLFGSIMQSLRVLTKKTHIFLLLLVLRIQLLALETALALEIAMFYEIITYSHWFHFAYPQTVVQADTT